MMVVIGFITNIVLTSKYTTQWEYFFDKFFKQKYGGTIFLKFSKIRKLEKPKIGMFDITISANQKFLIVFI